MQRTNPWVVVVLFLVAVQLSACGQDDHQDDHIVPALIEPIEGSDLSRLTLTAKAIERLGLETFPVQEADPAVVRPATGDGDGPRTVIPYAAVLYDAEGHTWAYVSTENRAFVRHAITIEYIEGDMVVLTDGPEVGVEVVGAGAAELYGAGFGVGH